MKIHFQKTNYNDLTAKQKESHNFQKLSGILADYGFETIRLNNDWNGADFLMLHRDPNGETYKVQLKSRFTLDRKYSNVKNLYIAFPNDQDWYIYHHGTILNSYLKISNIENDKVWIEKGAYSQNKLTKKLEELLHIYRISEEFDFQSCPICFNRTEYSTRYPKHICNDCFNRCTDENGTPVEFFNTDMLGTGVQGKIKNSERDYNENFCFIDKIKCTVDENRFGGIVIQVE